MLAIRLPEKIEKRLDRLAKRTGRTKTYYAERPSYSIWMIWRTSTSRRSALPKSVLAVFALSHWKK